MFGFTVGSIRERVKDGDEKLGEIGSGCANVADPSLCTHVPRVAIEVAERMTAFMRSTSLKHKCYDRIIGEGVFRQVMVRNSQSTKEALVVVQIKSEGLQKSELDAIRNGLLQVCEQLNEGWAAAATKKSNDDGGSNDKEIEQSSGTASSNGGDEESSRSCYRIVSALIQYNETRFEVNCDSKTEVIFGPGNFHESLLGVRFCVSPEAFFQINAKAAECLFETVRDWVSNPVPYPDEKKEEEGADGEVVETEQPVPTLKSDAKDSSTGSSTMASSPPVILDVCCGTGAIGLLLAKSAKMIYGLEIVAEAIEDAKRNAEINKIDNVKYYVGKAEETIKEVMESVSKQTEGDIIAVVDPPRGGLHPKVIEALRNCERVKYLVYVSCNAKSMMEDVKKMVQPCTKKLIGVPFKVIRTRPFDLFPQTLHFEMLMLLSRDHERGKARPNATRADRR